MNIRWVITQDTHGFPVVVEVKVLFIGSQWAIIILGEKECPIPVEGLCYSPEEAQQRLVVATAQLGMSKQ